MLKNNRLKAYLYILYILSHLDKAGYFTMGLVFSGLRNRATTLGAALIIAAGSGLTLTVASLAGGTLRSTTIRTGTTNC